MTTLLDGNVLVALSTPSHVHHERAAAWFAARGHRSFATCPVTQGTLLRVLVRSGATATEAARVLGSVTGHRGHAFWPDAIPYAPDMLRRVTGHAGFTDAYLVALCGHHGGGLATLDRGLAATHPDRVELIAEL